MSTDSPQLLVLPDAGAVTRATADLLVDALGRALVLRGEAILALSGGSTPIALYGHLVTRDLDWARVHVVQVDERFVADDDPERNWRAIEDRLVVPVGAIGHPMPAGGAVDEGLAADHAAELAVLGRIDACHLGLGDDGHTASLVPGDPALSVVDRDVVLAGPYEGRMRMTLTAPAINRSGRIVWQVVGASKQAAVRRLLEGDPADPSDLVRRSPEVWVVVDEAAGGGPAGDGLASSGP